MWPNYSYARHLEGRLPTIRRMLQEDWRHPLEARSSRNGDAVSHVIDGCLGTQWSTVWHQRRTDWLELDIETDLKVRGIALFSVPDFSQGPSGLTATGMRPNGQSVHLGTLAQVRAPHKGWVVMRFPPRRLRSVRVNLLRDATHSWTISEARVLTDANDVLSRGGEGAPTCHGSGGANLGGTAPRPDDGPPPYASLRLTSLR